MSNFAPFNRDQAFLMPPGLKAWLPEEDLTHFAVAAVERVPPGAFEVPRRTGGMPQHKSRLMLALLIQCHGNGIFSSRRIERATCRDVTVRFVAANLHPDHDTVATFRRASKAVIEAAFLQVLLLTREAGLLRLGTVSIDGTKIDANASRIRSVQPRSGFGAMRQAGRQRRSPDSPGRGGRHCRSRPADSARRTRPAGGAEGQA